MTNETTTPKRYLNNFEYKKETLIDDGSDLFFEVDYDRLRFLLKEYPKEALELALLSGAIDSETGEPSEDYKQVSSVDYVEWALLEVVHIVDSFALAGTKSLAVYFDICFSALIKGEPISKLTGLDWEWDDVSYMGAYPEGSFYSNVRFPSMVKGGKAGDGKASWYSEKKGTQVVAEFPCSIDELNK